MNKKASTAGIGCGMLLLCVVVLSLFVFVRELRSIPPMKPISDTPNLTDPSGRIIIKSIEMAAQPAVTLRSLFDVQRTSMLNTEVTNLTKTGINLGFEYYASSGSVGFYSPGVSKRAYIIQLPPEWSGRRSFEIHHAPFVGGGNLDVKFTICKLGQELDGIFIPTDVETIFTKKYNLTEKNENPK